MIAESDHMTHIKKANCGSVSWGITPRGPRRPTQCTVSSGYYPTGKRSVALLRLRGKWLEAMGFCTGTRLSVEVRDDGALILQPLPPVEPPPPVRRRR